jgi:hypothetical protein
MHHQLAVIQQCPATLAHTLLADRARPGLTQLVFNLVHNGADLAVRLPGGDDKAVSNHKLLGDINHGDLLRQLLVGGQRRNGRQLHSMVRSSHIFPSH